MSDERKDQEPEVEGHITPEGEDRIHYGTERQPHGRQSHGRVPAAHSEEEGPEVEGHRYYFGPDRAAGPERSKP
jgi:hypothetical protein